MIRVKEAQPNLQMFTLARSVEMAAVTCAALALWFPHSFRVQLITGFALTCHTGANLISLLALIFNESFASEIAQASYRQKRPFWNLSVCLETLATALLCFGPHWWFLVLGIINGLTTYSIWYILHITSKGVK